MNKKYVEINDFIDKAKSRLPSYAPPDWFDGYYDIINQLRDEPAADVQEVKHGKWIEQGIYSFKCSYCGEVEKYESPFCRWCGARMDGKENEK